VTATVIDQPLPAGVAGDSASAEKRIRALRPLIADGVAEAKRIRDARNAALLDALLVHKARGVDCMARVRMNRNAFSDLGEDAAAEEREVQAARAQDPKSFPDSERTYPREHYPTKDAALNAAEQLQQELDRVVAALKAHRDERNAIMFAMLAGRIRRPDGAPYLNEDVAELADVSSARVAQLKHPTPKAPRRGRASASRSGRTAVKRKR
jgi:hypothetical protein